MKIYSLLLPLVLVLGVVSCKKKSSESSGKSAKSASKASIDKGFGFKPVTTVFINLAALHKSDWFGLVKGAVVADITKSLPCMRDFVDGAESLVFVADNTLGMKKVEEGGEKKKDTTRAYLVAHGVPFAKVIKCIGNAPGAKVTKGKLNGRTAYVLKEKDETSYMFKGEGNSFIIVSSELAPRVTPGEGLLGKGELKAFRSTKTVAFTISRIEDLSQVRGDVDVSGGLKINFRAEVKNTRELDKMMAQYEQIRKNPEALPVPNLGKYLKGVHVERKGAAVTVKVDLPSDQVKELVGIAMTMFKRK